MSAFKVKSDIVQSNGKIVVATSVKDVIFKG